MSNSQKTIARIYPAPAKHWVGDGFHVHGMFNYNEIHKNLDPFLIMDYASPEYFTGGRESSFRGVGEHPHRGFETVTIAYRGEVEHRDSAGGGGVIGTGDVQWMTAGSGLMHSEFHSQAFSQTGGEFEMVQLWVNLPAAKKMTPPSYQAISKDDIPVVDLDGGHVRIIAGDFMGTAGAATTHSPVNLWDVVLKAGHEASFKLPDSHNLLILVRSGSISIDGQTAKISDLITFQRGGDTLRMRADSDSEFVLMSGEPLNEPIFGYGPFVMNSRDEIIEAMQDLESGKFGAIAH